MMWRYVEEEEEKMHGARVEVEVEAGRVGMF
jgi:hypothetical protein